MLQHYAAKNLDAIFPSDNPSKHTIQFCKRFLADLKNAWYIFPSLWGTQSVLSAGPSVLWSGGCQALGGGLCAIAAHCGGDGLGTGSHVGLEGVLESARQRIGGRCAGCVRGSDAEVVDTLGPVVLVVVLGNDDLRCAGSRGCGRGARAAVVDDGGNPFE